MGRSSVWVQVEGERQLRADRIHEVGAADDQGRLELRAAGHREPVYADLAPGASREQAGAWGRELLAMISVYAERRGETLIVFAPAKDGYLPYWSVRDLRTGHPLNRPELDREALRESLAGPAPDNERIAAATDRWQRERQTRLRELPPGA
ncbi:hypothetical protein ACEZCY_35690 [Streptacidiphilus sp. N1-12]|uniref:Uncharacterized protein n=1 Tax=Streptacidiphilus alkalitolerans TaxID=3342712 RepID=A0ABV6WS27_9ACTN